MQEGADRWVASGGSTLMVSLTIRHKRSDGLRESLDLLQRAYARLTSTGSWVRLLRGLGYVGQTRAVESPWGAVNGWHPHTHALLFFEGLVDDAALAAFEREAFRLWEAAVLREGGRPVLAGRGLRVTRGAAGYVAKVQESRWGAGSELVRVDLKRGRGGSVLPFELLDLESDLARSLWVEYVRVTHGRRALVWSRGMRGRLGLDAEISDDEVIDQAESADLVYLLDGPEYDRVRDVPGALVDHLERAEAMVRGDGHV